MLNIYFVKVFNYFCLSTGLDRERSTLDVLLSTTYSRSQLYLSRQLAQLHPELTMPMFSGEAIYIYFH
jgi:hypothetical protein